MKKTLLFVVMLSVAYFAQAQQDKATTLEAQDKTLELPPPPPNNQDERVFTFVEQKPEFPGGENALMQYLAKYIKYPENAILAYIEGKVIVQFIVAENGSIMGAKILRGIGRGCDEEALRVVNAMPKWKPGKVNNRPVMVEYMLPIEFRLKSPTK